MACITGFSNAGNCASNYAGISRLKIIPYEDITVRTADGSDAEAYSAMTLASGAQWYEYDFEIDTAIHTETKEEGRTKRWTQSFVFDFGQRSGAARNRVMEFLECHCGLSIAYEDENGTNWLVEGKNRGLFLTGNEATSGEAGGQASDVVTFTAMSDQKARVYTGTWVSLSITS